MKKILALSAALSLVSAQAFAQTAETPAPVAATATTAVVADAPTSDSPLARLQARTGMTPGGMVAVGVAIAATIAIIADNGDDETPATTTHHAATTHH